MEIVSAITRRTTGSKTIEIIFVVAVVVGFSVRRIMLYVTVSISIVLYCFRLYKCLSIIFGMIFK